MLFGLFFTACAIGAPLNSIDCQTHVHRFDETVQTPMQCVRVAQAQLAQWSLNHAGYRITGCELRSDGLSVGVAFSILERR